MIRRIFSTLLFCNTLCLFAGDHADFCSVGWSEDYHYYAFAQYGEQDGSGFPYAELYVVDIARNNYVPNGIFQRLWSDLADPGARGINALLELRVAADSLLKACHILDHLQIRPVFVHQDDEAERAAWVLNSQEYSLVLHQESRGNPAMFESEAAFHLLLKTATTDSVFIGLKERFRKYVLRYDIDRILQTADGRSLVIVIRMTKLGFEGPDIRYMVETVQLPRHAKKEIFER